jgi:Arm DNA-binding domain
MRTINRLSAAKIAKTKPGPDGRAVLLCDGGGLWLQVGRGKENQTTRSWLFRYAVPGTKISRTGREYRRERQMGLGPLHTISLLEARERAAHARLLRG